MRSLICICFSAVFCGLCEGQPLKYKNELVFDYSVPQSCLNKKSFVKCHESRISASILSGSLGVVQTTGVFKLTGKSGKLGGQAWIQINDYFWIGGESVTDLEFDFNHEIFLSLDFQYGKYHFYPYLAFLVKDEHFAAFGGKVYISESVSFGAEYRFDEEEEHMFSMSLGMAIKPGTIDLLKERFFPIEEGERIAGVQ